MIYEKNDGIIRGTGFLSMGLGMILYNQLLSKQVIRIGYGIFGKPMTKAGLFLYKRLKKITKAVKLKVETTDKKEGGTYDKSSKKFAKRS